MTSNYEQFVEEATNAASQGKWDVAFESLSQAHKLKPDDPGVLTGIAQCAMNLGMMKDAMTFFQQVIILAPDSPVAHFNLGYVQDILGLVDDAEGSYQMAITLDPDSAEAWKNLAMLYIRGGYRAEEGAQILNAVRLARPDDPEPYYLLGECYEMTGDLVSAKQLYERTLELDPDHPFVADKLEELKQKGMPQAPVSGTLPPFERIAKPEHAKKLASLKELIKKPEASAAAGGSRPLRSLAFYGPPELAAEARISPPARAFSKAGREVKLSTKFSQEDLETADFFLFANPHYSKEMMSAVRQALHASAAHPGVRVAVDLDRDFYALPIDMPEFAHVGAGNPPLLKELEELLSRVDFLTLPSEALKAVYGKFARRIALVPPTWSRADALWDKTAPKRKTVNIGVVCTHTRAADVAVMKAALGRILDAFPDAMLAVGGEMSLFNAFDQIPEARKTFIPIGQAKDYPYLLANFDLLLVPLEDILYNQHASDAALMEAGIRRIPWIASGIPAFREWGEGGVIASSEKEWEEALRDVLSKPEKRAELGAAGRSKAEQREADACLDFWDEILKN